MRNRFNLAIAVSAALILGSAVPSIAQNSSSPATVPVRMVVTVSGAKDNPAPTIERDDVMVRQGKDRRKVLEWTAAKGDNAGLDLFILVDEAADASSFGSKMSELQEFINAQPASTSIGLGYMRNATFQLVQNFTTDHALVAKSVRLPLGFGTMSSPYLSLIDLVKRWSGHSNRRAVLMISDGIDRYRNAFRGFGPRGLQPLSPDALTARDQAQKAGVPVYALYVRGSGYVGHSFWQASNGQYNLSMICDETGGDSFSLLMGDPVSYKPYLSDFQKILDNQYLLSFAAVPGKKAGLQTVKIMTEVPHAELRAADSVWVPAVPK